MIRESAGRDGSSSTISRPTIQERRLRQLAFVAIVLAVVGTYLDGKPGWLDAYPINVLYVAFGGIVYAGAAYRRRGEDGHWFLPGIALTVVLGWLFYSQGWGRGFTTDAGWLIFVAVFVLFVVYPFAHPDGLDHLSEVPVYVLGVIALLGAYFYHTATGGGTFPFRVGFVLVMNLLFVPRYVSRRTFLRTATVTAGVVATLGLVAYVVGEYAVFSIPVQLYPATFPLPLGLGRVNDVLQSVFVNPNGTGLLLFVGVFGAVVELHDAGLEDPGYGRAIVAGGLGLLNGIGLFLTYSRASWAAAVIAVGIYLAYAEYGRRTLPYAVTAAIGLVVLGLLAIATSALGVDPSGRFALWSGAIQAFLADPSLFGKGIVGTGDIIAPYVPEPHAGYSAHNSYLSTAIQAGIVGTIGYLVLAVGSVVDATYLRRSGDPVMLGLAVAFAVHQLFEAYALFHYVMGSVLASLAIGYLLVGDRNGEDSRRHSMRR